MRKEHISHKYAAIADRFTDTLWMLGHYKKLNLSWLLIEHAK